MKLCEWLSTYLIALLVIEIVNFKGEKNGFVCALAQYEVET
jgi:hypothetical protein